jgi:hypothetical protein
MRQCMSERALLRFHSRDGTAAEREHLRLCADCTERYDQLVEDLATLHLTLEAPQPAAAVRRFTPFLVHWAPMAAAAAGLAAVIVVSVAGRHPLVDPVQVATRSTAVSAFAADVSAALFADSESAGTAALPTVETSYLQAALDAGSPCTREQYLDGECDEQLSALLSESE